MKGELRKKEQPMNDSKDDDHVERSKRRGNTSQQNDSVDELIYTRTKKECQTLDEGNEKSDSEETCSDFDSVAADFDFFDPDAKFYHTIRHFFTESVLMGLELKEGVETTKPKKKEKRLRMDSDQTIKASTAAQHEHEAPLASRLANCVSDQGNIGTVVCVGTHEGSEPDSPVGFSTILNFKQYFDQGLKSIQLFLLNSARKRLDSRQYRTFKNIVDANFESRESFSRNKLRLHKKKGIPLPCSELGKAYVVGLFLNERLLNLPHDIVPKLLDNLHQDVLWSQTTPECPEDERQHYFFTHLVGLSHCFVFDHEQGNFPHGTDATTTKFSHFSFRKFEDELFLKNSLVYFTIPTSYQSRIPAPHSQDGVDSLVSAREHRLVFLVEYSKFLNVIRECEQVLKQQHLAG